MTHRVQASNNPWLYLFVCQSEAAQIVCQFQYIDWPSDQEVPRFLQGMLSLMELTQEWLSEEGPIVVHCM